MTTVNESKSRSTRGIVATLGAMLLTPMACEANSVNRDGLDRASESDCVEPQFTVGNGNDWWREFETNQSYSAVELQVQGGETYDMEYRWNKWVLGDVQTPTGTRMRLKATTAGGQQGQTEWFAYLEQTPTAAACSTCDGDTTYDAKSDASHDVGGGTDDGWILWSNGGLQVQHDFDGESELSITARGMLYGDQAPKMRVSANGVELGTRSVSSASMASYTFDVSGLSGSQTIAVEFTNDAYGGPGNDRNLVVQSIAVSCDGGGGGGGGGGGDGDGDGGGGDGGGGGPAETIVDAHGQLSIDGRYVVDECGRVTQLRGMSFFWHQWDNSAAFWNQDVVEWLEEDWNVQILRGAVGIHPSGWFADPDAAEQATRRLIDAAIEAGVYVVIDWHSHDIHLDEAKGFFSRIAADYGDSPNVIYEIFNEPDGNSWTDLDETWPEIKEYSRELISTIREHDPDNIIVVGTPFYDQFVDQAADSPITVDSNNNPVSNIAYTLHVYAGAHKQSIRDKAQYAVDRDLPLFMTESGRTGTSWGPNNSLDAASWDTWEEWLDDNSISWLRWSLSTKNEVSSSLQPSASMSGGWSASDLRSEGTWNRNHFRSVNSIPSKCN